MGPVTGFVTGLAAEARLVRAIRRPVAWGADPAASARRLIAQGVECLVSFGLAGGLAPALRPGTLVIATEVVADGGSFPCLVPEWTSLNAPLAGSDHALATPAAKAALHVATGAVAVDMESHRVARVAATASLPLMVIRAIADPAERAIPGLALRAIRDGRLLPLPLAADVLRHPAELPALLRLARDYRAAMASLRAALDQLS